MLAAVTELKNAEKLKKELIKQGAMNQDHNIVKELNYIYFPLSRTVKIKEGKIKKVNFSFPEKEKPLTLEGILKNKLTPSEIKLIPRSQEIIGDILILEIPEELKKKENEIAKAYLLVHKNIKTVVKKSSKYHGTYRTRKVTILAGEKKKETLHQENGIKLLLHLENTYYSGRSANERLRIAQLVKKGERVLVMFSGAGPYPLVIAKNSEAEEIYGVEINPLAHQYAFRNLELNGLGERIIFLEGNVNKIVPKIKGKFDRIVMPLPMTGEEFLSLALSKIKKNGAIHYYNFIAEENFSKEARRIRELCQGLKHKVSILRTVKCGQFAPGTFRVCFDIKVLS